MTGLAVVWGLAALVIGASWWYFRTWTMTRPPLGTVNLGDITMTLVFVIVLPFLYLWLPGWLVVTMLALTSLSILWFVAEPVTTAVRAKWGFAGGLVIGELLLAGYGAGEVAFLLLNDAVILMMVVGVSNVWAQGGLRSRDLAIFAGGISVYDLIATGVFPLTTGMIERLSGFPFLPMVVWPSGENQWVGIGMGDLLMAAVGPLVIRKAFGWAAGLTAVVIALGAIAGVLLVSRWSAMPETFPTMIVLGPMMIAQHLCLCRRYGSERTYALYLLREPAIARHVIGRHHTAIADPRPLEWV